MTDLERACAALRQTGNTCAVCRGDALYTSTARGVRPVLDWIDGGVSLRGFSAADKVVGRAAAFLFVQAGIVRLYADTVSEPALAVLNAYGVPTEYARLVPGIVNRAGDGPCPMEASVLDTDDPDEAMARIRRKLAELSAQAQ